MLGTLGCRSGNSAPAPALGPVELERVAENALSATMPESPVQITFDFRLKEADLRFEGRGVAREEPP